MRSIIFLLTLASFSFASTLSAQAEDTQYAIVEYMKVKPGMEEQYQACEAVWKKVHQARKEAGYIVGWQLEQVLYPSGLGTAYDFLTITQVKSWSAMAKLQETWNEATWAELTKGLTSAELELADKANDYRDLVKREIWTVDDSALADGKHPKFSVENYMSILPTHWEAWQEMERGLFKPVHQQSMALGTRSGWMMTKLVLPRGQGLPYQGSTIDLYDTWEDMAKSTDEAWEAVYPTGMNYEMVNERSNALRTIVRTEVRMMVDQIN